ncbi:uncharacterized protein LOC120351045 [Nilaparvata lugens]|uniref:uncharacterized protein LOC120351045 n=1 Tax=Nilaparvata lugens TaxID=108931 RepID=UPI00193EA623|nr:uncharacterized protein LOC120351045 [Nilaparvata lugens]
MKTMIQLYVGEHHADWDRYVEEFCFTMNTAVHVGTKYTPAFLNFGRELRAPGDACGEEEGDPRQEDGGTSRAAQLRRLQVLKRAQKLVLDNLNEAYNNTRRYYNLMRRPLELRTGQLVYKRDYHLSSGVNQFAAKLAPKFSGPYEVEKMLSASVVLLKGAAGKRLTVHVKDIKILPPLPESRSPSGSTSRSPGRTPGSAEKFEE